MDKETCWYKEGGVKEMNVFYDKHIKNGCDYFIQEHMNVFKSLIDSVPNGKLLDLGCGTGMLSEFCNGHEYYGADMFPVLSGSAMLHYPNYYYRVTDITEDNLSWIGSFDTVVLNAVIDVMENPLEILEKVLSNCIGEVIIHRQEITEGQTKVIKNNSYGGYTYHSIVSREDFLHILDMTNYVIDKEEKLSFGNWEDGGRSFLLKKRQSWALNMLDHKLYERCFKGKANGFYIEAGANDGLLQNNTMFLEKYKGWKGVLIEPFPELIDRCQRNRSKENIFVKAALVSDEFVSPEIPIIFTPTCDGLMSVINDAYGKQRVEDTNIGLAQCVQTRVYATSLNKIFKHHNIKRVDVMILDVEGYEVEALKGIDFSKCYIEYLLIEQLEEKGIAELISPYYDFVEKLSEHDYLYKRKTLL